MEQRDVQLHEYEREEVVTVTLLGTALADVATGDYVEVSGQELLFNPCPAATDYLCDAFAFMVCPECVAGEYIRRI